MIPDFARSETRYASETFFFTLSFPPLPISRQKTTVFTLGLVGYPRTIPMFPAVKQVSKDDHGRYIVHRNVPFSLIAFILAFFFFISFGSWCCILYYVPDTAVLYAPRGNSYLSSTTPAFKDQREKLTGCIKYTFDISACIWSSHDQQCPLHCDFLFTDTWTTRLPNIHSSIEASKR